MSETLKQSIELQEHELSPEFSFGRTIADVLTSSGNEAYFTGGYCRDLMLDKQPKDVDIATSTQPENTQALLQKHGINVKYVAAAEAYPVVIANKQDVSIEIATFRKDVYQSMGDTRRPTMMVTKGATLEDDANRRDLTINALYFNPLTQEMLDPTGQGVTDLLEQQIRFVGNASQRIQEDRLRILRAIRFKNRFGFEYEVATKQALIDHRNEILKLSADRIRDELTKTLLMPSRAQVIRDLDELGLLTMLLPEFTAGKGIKQPPEFHSEGDVFTHQLMVVEKLPEKVNLHTIWAAMLHDIGKPQTQTSNELGRVSFPNHDQVGADMARAVLTKLKFPNKDIERIVWLVENHMRIRELPKMKRAKQLRFVHPENLPHEESSDAPIDNLLTLLKADNQGSVRPNGTVDQAGYEQIEKIVQQLKTETPKKLPTIKKDFGVSGDDLIKYLEIHKNDRVSLQKLGVLIHHLDELLQNQEITSHQEIYGKTRQWWNNK